MRINSSYICITQQPAQKPRMQAATGSFAAEPGSAQEPARQDFSRMTRREMRDWLTDQTGKHAVTLEESRALFFMTMKIPVGVRGPQVEVPVEQDNLRMDFTQRAREGLEAARSDGDVQSIKSLDAALALMRR